MSAAKPVRRFAKGEAVRVSPTARHWCAGLEAVVDQYTSPSRCRIMVPAKGCGTTIPEADLEKVQ